MKLKQEQRQQLSQQQLQNLTLLRMSTLELREYIQELSTSNPLVEPDDLPPAPQPSEKDSALDRLRWLRENDHQNQYLWKGTSENADPLALAGNAGGLEETLTKFIERQLDRRSIDETEKSLVLFLAECLDPDGYLRDTPEELALDIGADPRQMVRAWKTLRALEPAGIGASTLSDCLLLQLERSAVTGIAFEICRSHMDALARHNYRSIAQKLHVAESEVITAADAIRQLDPRPGSVFQTQEAVVYVLPDVYVEEKDGALSVRLSSGEQAPFHINTFYLDLLRDTADPAVKEYLTARLRQAENVLYAIHSRTSTLLKCTEVIVRRQSGFFLDGAELRTLRMLDVAEELSVHESTVSRTVRGKYLQCSRGLYPLSYFFSASAVKNSRIDLGSAAAKSMLKKLIDSEDSAHPLSDQKLCEALASHGCPISRRTVAKYRGELNIPGASARKR
ncbi:MAG: RNA polymerase factor sigma-54 [Oscillospiraceae bacterium]|nr:RNA polymerase factor sigma-54 [Oscillospiraceae bacterium]